MKKLTEEQRKLVEDNEKLVHYVVHRYFNPPPGEFDDYVQEGLVQLCTSAIIYDKSKGTKFSTLAVPSIIGKLKQYRRNFRPIKFSRRLYDLKSQIAYYRNSCEGDFDEDKMLNALGVSKKDYWDILFIENVVSLDEPLTNDREDLVLGDAIVDTLSEDITDNFVEGILIDIESEMLNGCTKIVRDVYDEYFYEALTGVTPKQIEIARKYGVSRAYVSHIVRKYNKELLARYKNEWEE